MEWRFETAADISPSMLHTELMTKLHECGAPDEDYDAAELIVGELVGNAVRHARGSVTIVLDWTGEFPTLCVCDGDRYPTHVIDLPADPLAESGRGLFIVQALAKSFSLHDRGEAGSAACATLPVRRRAA